MRAGVYVVPGSKLYGADPGWIRLIFSVGEEELDEGRQRKGFLALMMIDLRTVKAADY